MAGIFSLGGGGGRGNNNQDDQQRNPPTQIPPPDTLFWYNKNVDDVSSYRGFELWHHQQQVEEEQVIPQARPLFQQDLYSLGVGPSRASDMVTSSAIGGISCQDCGNQAKKDCPHMRCRTCCKSRGYDCQTHVKSTWVPASKRRERQQHLSALQQQQQQQQQHDGDVPRRHRERDHNPTSSSALASSRLPSNPLSSGLEHGNFPAMVSSPAEFRCVHVSSMDDAEGQYAYQTAVNIGGHVFKGILYDQGPDSSSYMAGESSSTGVGGGVQPLNFIAAAPTTAAVVSSTGALVDPSSLYPPPLNTFVAGSGTQFFPHPRS